MRTLTGAMDVARVRCVQFGAAARSRFDERRVRVSFVSSAALISAMMSMGPTPALAEMPTPGVVPPSDTLYGLNYSQWSAAQWQWELEQQNVNASPVVDPNAGTASNPEKVDCALDQSGSVWFLAGITFLQSYTVAYRRCSVPRGVALFFPVIDSWIDDLSCPGVAPSNSTGDQLRQAVEQQTNSIVPGSMSVTVDERSVRGLSDSSTAYRASANGFSYTLPANNALSQFCPGNPFPAGTMPPNPPGAYADGVYIMLYPLPAGIHRINFSAKEGKSGPFGPVNEKKVSYVINVMP